MFYVWFLQCLSRAFFVPTFTSLSCTTCTQYLFSCLFRVLSLADYVFYFFATEIDGMHGRRDSHQGSGGTGAQGSPGWSVVPLASVWRKQLRFTTRSFLRGGGVEELFRWLRFGVSARGMDFGALHGEERKLYGGKEKIQDFHRVLLDHRVTCVGGGSIHRALPTHKERELECAALDACHCFSLVRACGGVAQHGLERWGTTWIQNLCMHP